MFSILEPSFFLNESFVYLGLSSLHRDIPAFLVDLPSTCMHEPVCMNFVTGPTIPPPTMKELMNNVHTVKTFELGIQLDLDLSDVNTAMADHKNDARGQLIKILSLYSQQTMDPSWLHVATALYTIGENKCAADIEQRFGE